MADAEGLEPEDVTLLEDDADDSGDEVVSSGVVAFEDSIVEMELPVPF